MDDQEAFLRDKADELRGIAAVSPKIAAELRQIAEDLERLADEIARDRGKP
ncbi:MAG TPA: hypothetical protein VM755_09210 [Stellaceae bacterium]|nr:hypothetical protein [Stellaceae bacterium]